MLLANMVEEVAFRMMSHREKGTRVRLRSFLPQFVSSLGRNAGVFATAVLNTVRVAGQDKAARAAGGGHTEVELRPWCLRVREALMDSGVVSEQRQGGPPVVTEIIGSAVAAATTTALTAGGTPVNAAAGDAGGARTKGVAPRQGSAGKAPRTTSGKGSAAPAVSARAAAASIAERTALSSLLASTVERRRMGRSSRAAFPAFSQDVVNYLSGCLLTAMLDEYGAEKQRRADAVAAAQKARREKRAAARAKAQAGAAGAATPSATGGEGGGSGGGSDEAGGAVSNDGVAPSADASTDATTAASPAKAQDDEASPARVSSVYALSCSRLLQMLAELVRAHPGCIKVSGAPLGVCRCAHTTS